MKKAMLFMIALLFSVGVNAATINITNTGLAPNNVVTGIFPNNDSTAVASFATSTTEFGALNDVTTDTTGYYQVQWTFNPSARIVSADVGKGDGTFATISSAYTYVLYMLANTTYHLDIFNGVSTNQMGYQLSVSSVPVPAALWLFAPALLGFFGLRRKSSSQALVAA